VLLLASPILGGLLIVAALLFAYSRIQLPQELPPLETTYLYDRNGEIITTLHGAVDRTVVPIEDMSPHILHAVVATEDHDFYEHSGVDPIGILRAAWTNLRGTDNEIQGASTITQQVVKNVYAGSYVTDPETGIRSYVIPERSLKEKVREALLALKLEDELGKDEILAKYLNTVYFGHGAYGVEAAAQTYFGKPASKLTILESAVLAGTLHAPELYDPIDRPDDNWFRRNYVLDQMAAYGYLDPARAENFKGRKCCGIPKEILQAEEGERIVAPGDAEYFVEYTRQRLFDIYGEAQVYGGGLEIVTSLDLELQAAAEQAIATHLPDEATDPGAALVAMDVQTGQILAMAGGRDWVNQKVNLATFSGGSGRLAGSAFKAFTLAAAIKEGYDLTSRWYGPYTMPIQGCPDPGTSDGLWHPVNAEGSGSYSLADATAHSVNTIFAQLIAQLGPEKVVDMAHALGIRSELPAYCSITLGSVAVNPLEMTNAYATLAARGVRHWATPLMQVKTPDGKIDESIVEEGEQVLAQNDADLVTYALQGVVSKGTGRAASIYPFPAAGKTGSAKDNVDAWFCGYTAQIATCVWIGYIEGEIPLENVQGVPRVYGGTIPAAIWQDFMSVAMDGYEPVAFPAPSFDGYSTGPLTPAPLPSPSPVPCGSVTPTAGATPSPCPIDTPSPSVEPSPTETPKPTKSTTPSPTGSPTPKPTKSTTPSPTESSTPKPTKSTTPSASP
jgi:membrane peptidoglycan carboxypeptidase